MFDDCAKLREHLVFTDIFHVSPTLTGRLVQKKNSLCIKTKKFAYKSISQIDFSVETR